MQIISAAQVKAARALLGWSQDDLAVTAGISVTTIRNLESGEMSLRTATMDIIRLAFERAGIEFTGDEGLRRRSSQVKIYEGRDSCDVLFDDIQRTLREKSGQLLCLFKSSRLLIETCGIVSGGFGHLEAISKNAPVKCLFGDMFASELLANSDSVEFRTILKQHIGPASYFIYGDKQAMVLAEGNPFPQFFVFSSLAIAQDHRNHFFALWQAAPPVYTELR
jgi:transcriptional regulator with XRE-family HTH domain